LNIGLKLDSQEVDSRYLAVGLGIVEEVDSRIQETIKKFKLRDGSLNGKAMTADWFPIVNADVFISHSHKDLEIALSLAGQMKSELDINCFIDSCVWKYADDLLKLVDDEYCWQPASKTYNYSKRNYSTSHVHMMLSVALNKMMDNCEALIFLNTPNSITPDKVVTDEDETLSPWIYAELSSSHLIRNRPLKDHRRVGKSMDSLQEMFSSRDLKVRHEVDISHLRGITIEAINRICRSSSRFQNKYEALDAIYKATI
jgi:hypothetical protein